MLIGISGKIGVGKDIVGRIMQYLVDFYTMKSMEKTENIDAGLPENPSEQDYLEWLAAGYDEDGYNEWKIKKFAGKLKQIVALLTGIPIEDLEKQEVKDSVLPKEWDWLYDANLHRGIAHTDHLMEGRERKYTVRLFMQQLGTEALRYKLHMNTWINALFADYTIDSTWIITDLRFPDEVQAIKERKGILIRVTRGKIAPCVAHDQHPSETALDDYKGFNYVIKNNGTLEELVLKTKEILEKENLIKTNK
jgi:hypothetical protein